MPIDTTSFKSPPRRTTPIGRNSSPSKPVLVDVRSPNEKREEGLLGLAQMGQALCLMTNQYADAAAIGTHFPPIAKELAKIAETNEAIAKPIDFLIEIGPYGALISAVLPLALQIAANHGWIKADAMIGQGVVPPEVLESQMRAQVTRMQAQALKEQQQALAEAQAMQREYEATMTAVNGSVPAAA